MCFLFSILNKSLNRENGELRYYLQNSTLYSVGIITPVEGPPAANGELAGLAVETRRKGLSAEHRPGICTGVNAILGSRRVSGFCRCGVLRKKMPSNTGFPFVSYSSYDVDAGSSMSRRKSMTLPEAETRSNCFLVLIR